MIDKDHVEDLYEHGCICCKKDGFTPRWPEFHHIVEGYRLGDAYILPLCSWHHRGEPPSIDMKKSHAYNILGPNLRDNKKEFVAHYGTERSLLREVDEWRAERAEERARRRNASSLTN